MQVQLVLMVVVARIVHSTSPTFAPVTDCTVFLPEVYPADQNMNEALIHRGWIGDPDGIREWLKCGANIDAVDARYGRTALMCASYNGHVDAVKVLVEKRADANIKGSVEGQGKRKTALDLASECRSTVPNECHPHFRSDEEMDKAKAEIEQLLENQVIIDNGDLWKIKKEMENEFMALWSTHWKYAVVGVGVLILVMIIICIVCICRQKVPCCSGYDPLPEKDDVLKHVEGGGAAAKTTHMKHVGGGGAAAKTAHMQNIIWNAIVGPLQQGEGVYFHYTSKEFAPLIEQSGFKVSKLGMEGTGTYFSEYPPVYLPGLGRWPNSKFPQWPNPGFKEGLLRLNYGDAAATDPCRQNLVEAVIIVKVPTNIVKTVSDRPGAICIADQFYCHNNETYMMKNQIVKVVELF